ncbi:MAG: DUF3052 domain-containing protein [Alphaproteobacteria bacterium]
MAGYSGTPLPRKLGIKEGCLLRLDGAPDAWGAGWPESQEPLPVGVRVRSTPVGPKADVMLAFFVESRRLKRRFSVLKKKIKDDGALWIAWPKKAARVESDLDGNVVREIGLERGMVDVKVCAVDETWSGLKFVYRLVDRPPPGRGSRRQPK